MEVRNSKEFLYSFRISKTVQELGLLTTFLISNLDYVREAAREGYLEIISHVLSRSVHEGGVSAQELFPLLEAQPLVALEVVPELIYLFQQPHVVGEQQVFVLHLIKKIMLPVKEGEFPSDTMVSIYEELRIFILGVLNAIPSQEVLFQRVQEHFSVLPAERIEELSKEVWQRLQVQKDLAEEIVTLLV